MADFYFVIFVLLGFGTKYGIFIIPPLFVAFILAWFIHQKHYSRFEGEKNGWKYWFILFTLFLPLWSALNAYRFYIACEKQIGVVTANSSDINSILFTGIIFPFLWISFLALIRIVIPLILAYFLHKRIKYSACRKLCIFVAFGFFIGSFLGLSLLMFLGHSAIDSEFNVIDEEQAPSEANKSLEADA